MIVQDADLPDGDGDLEIRISILEPREATIHNRIAEICWLDQECVRIYRCVCVVEMGVDAFGYLLRHEGLTIAIDRPSFVLANDTSQSLGLAACRAWSVIGDESLAKSVSCRNRRGSDGD
jgi:hypothetical protein